MRVWFLEGEIAIELFVLFLVLSIASMLLYYRVTKRRLTRQRINVMVFFIALVSLLIGFTIFPLPEANDAIRTEPLSSYWQLNPLDSILDAMAVLGEVGPISFLGTAAFLQLFFNIVLFVPVGIFIAFVSEWKDWRKAALLGLAVSFFIEVVQGTGLFGLYNEPYRLADVDDLLLNTAGCIVGFKLAIHYKRTWSTHQSDLETAK